MNEIGCEQAFPLRQREGREGHATRFGLSGGIGERRFHDRAKADDHLSWLAMIDHESIPRIQTKRYHETSVEARSEGRDFVTLSTLTGAGLAIPGWTGRTFAEAKAPRRRGEARRA